MRAWRVFPEDRLARHGIEGITSFGPLQYMCPGRLGFIVSDRFLADISGDGGSLLCPRLLCGEVDALGFDSIPSSDPAEAFWALAREVETEEQIYSNLLFPERVIADAKWYHDPTARIASVAFKAIKRRGQRALAPSLGGVMLGEGVTIGAHASLDAGIYGEYTEIGDGTHIDNLVHVGHSAVVGKNVTVVAGTSLGGWCEIGDNTWLGINSSVRDSRKVGRNVMVGMGAVVVRDIPDYAVVVGNPAKVIRYEYPEEG